MESNGGRVGRHERPPCAILQPRLTSMSNLFGPALPDQRLELRSSIRRRKKCYDFRGRSCGLDSSRRAQGIVQERGERRELLRAFSQCRHVALSVLCVLTLGFAARLPRSLSYRSSFINSQTPLPTTLEPLEHPGALNLKPHETLKSSLHHSRRQRSRFQNLHGSCPEFVHEPAAVVHGSSRD